MSVQVLQKFKTSSHTTPLTSYRFLHPVPWEEMWRENSTVASPLPDKLLGAFCVITTNVAFT